VRDDNIIENNKVITDRVYIYGLVDPRNKEIQYVGKASFPYERLSRHIYSSKYLKNKKDIWIDLLKQNNMRPFIKILEICNFSDWEIRERYWIAKYREINKNLLNIEDGGITHGSKRRVNKSDKYIGVYKDKNHGEKFFISITIGSQKVRFGGFLTEEIAAEMYDLVIIKFYGRSGRLNFDENHNYSVEFKIKYANLKQFDGLNTYCIAHWKLDLDEFLEKPNKSTIEELRFLKKIHKRIGNLYKYRW
jgi:hypothetical protein